MALTAIDWSQDLSTWLAGDGADLDEDIDDITVTPDPPDWANTVRSFIQAQYPFQRGVATSLKGRAANSTGVIADIAASTLGHVMRRDATPALSFGTMLAGGFATGPGVITPAMMDNGPARSVVARSANSSGARADVAGAGTAAIPQALSDDGTTVAFRSFAALRDPSSVIYEVNFSGLGANTLVDGTEVIDGLNWVAANMGELGTAAVQNGTGIRMVCATSNGGATAFTAASQLAPYIRLPLSQLSGFDPMADYIVEVYMSSLVLETTGENVFLSMWGQAASPYASSGSRIRKVQILNNAGTRVLRTTDSADGTSDVAIPTHNVMALRIGHHGYSQSYSGVWSSGWPTVLTPGPVMALGTPTLGTLNTGDVSIVLGIALANDASPTTAVTFERMRVRRVS